MQVTVEPGALAEWSAQARRAAALLRDRLAALDRDVAPLARSWQGAAADGFAARHAQWRHATDGLAGTLDRLAALVDTARANYLAAAAANDRTWQTARAGPAREVTLDHTRQAAHGAAAQTTAAGRGGPIRTMSAGRGTAAVAVRAMSAGRGRIRADVEDIRATVRAVLVASDALVAGWAGLGAGLAGSAAMAGGDEAGAGFGADYDGMAAAAWQGLHRCVLMVDGIAGGLAATGNNLAEAERASTPGAAPPFVPITARGGAPPSPAPPPPAGGTGAHAGVLADVAFWPTAEPDRLRVAGAAWRRAAGAVREAVGAVLAAVDALVAAHPDATLAQVRGFTGAALSTDPTSGLVGVVAGTGGRIASACDGLADLTEHTRARIRGVLAHHADGDEWYHPVADAVDAVVRARPGRFVAGLGDAYLLRLDLSAIHDEHLRAVVALRGELHPAGAERLARIATAMAPPTPVPAGTCRVSPPEGPVGDPLPASRRHELVDEVVAAGHKISAEQVVQIARAPDGRVVWLERGDDRSGLGHILRAGRIRDFVDRGVEYAEIPGLPLRAVTTGTWRGRVRDGDVYDVDLGGGRSVTMVVVVGSNGYVVSAYPVPAGERAEGGHR